MEFILLNCRWASTRDMDPHLRFLDACPVTGYFRPLTPKMLWKRLRALALESEPRAGSPGELLGNADSRVLAFPLLIFLSLKPRGAVGFPSGASGKESACNAGDLGWIPRVGRSPGGGHGNLLQHSCLESLTNRGAWWATVHGVAKSWTRLSNWAQLNPKVSIITIKLCSVFLSQSHRF